MHFRECGFKSSQWGGLAQAQPAKQLQGQEEEEDSIGVFLQG